MIGTNPRAAELKKLDFYAKLLDGQFRIPGTNIRFGLDALIGLIPGVGDLTSLIISGFLISTLAKNGASGFVLAKMIGNVIIDAAIGSIPVIGDIFDVAFRANQRNVQLLREHYVEGRHKGGAWKVVVPAMLLLAILLAGAAWVAYKLFVWVAGFF